MKSVLDHRKLVHGIKSKSRCIKHFDLEPNIYDSENYCTPCERSFPTIKKYRRHLRDAHYMALKSIRSKPHSGMISDLDVLNFYCCSCGYTYISKDSYHHHLKLTHSIKPAPCNMTGRKKKNYGILPEWDNEENYCPSCEIKCKQRHSYLKYCKHKTTDNQTSRRK